MNMFPKISYDKKAKENKKIYLLYHLLILKIILTDVDLCYIVCINASISK